MVPLSLYLQERVWQLLDLVEAVIFLIKNNLCFCNQSLSLKVAIAYHISHYTIAENFFFNELVSLLLLLIMRVLS